MLSEDTLWSIATTLEGYAKSASFETSGAI